MSWLVALVHLGTKREIQLSINHSIWVVTLALKKKRLKKQNMSSKEISTLASTISLWDIRTSRTLTINTISASLFFWAEDSSVTHPLVVFRTTVFFCFLRTVPVYNLLHMYARTTGASTKQKKESQTMGEQKLYWEPLSFQKYQHCCIQDSKEACFNCMFVVLWKKTFFLLQPQQKQ